MANDTFDPASAENVPPGLLVNNNTRLRTAQNDGSLVAAHTVLSHDFFTTTGYYLEFIMNDPYPPTDEQTGVGLCVSNPDEGAVNLVMFADGAVYNGPTNITTLPLSFIPGCVVGIAIENGLVWFRINGGDWNGDPAADPTRALGGVAITAGCQYAFATIQALVPPDYQTVTSDIQAGPPFTFAPPAGFLGWSGNEPVSYVSTGSPNPPHPDAYHPGAINPERAGSPVPFSAASELASPNPR